MTLSARAVDGGRTRGHVIPRDARPSSSWATPPRPARDSTLQRAGRQLLPRLPDCSTAHFTRRGPDDFNRSPRGSAGPRRPRYQPRWPSRIGEPYPDQTKRKSSANAFTMRIDRRPGRTRARGVPLARRRAASRSVRSFSRLCRVASSRSWLTTISPRPKGALLSSVAEDKALPFGSRERRPGTVRSPPWLTLIPLHEWLRTKV